MSTPEPTDELRKQVRNAMQCDDREHLDSNDLEACYNCQVDKVVALFAARESAIREGATDKVTRFEVIANADRLLVKYGVKVELSYQDDNRTLKVFLSDGPAPTVSGMATEGDKAS